jgi:hypothetical protein
LRHVVGCGGSQGPPLLQSLAGLWVACQSSREDVGSESQPFNK